MDKFARESGNALSLKYYYVVLGWIEESKIIMMIIIVYALCYALFF